MKSISLTTVFIKLLLQNVNFESNVFVSDIAGAQNIKSKVASLSFKSGKDEVKVNNTKSPIVIKLENKPEDLQAKNISLFMPGKIKVHAVKLDSMSCNLMLNMVPMNGERDKEAELVVYVQYGKPATKQSHDFQLIISHGKQLQLLKNNQVVNKTITSNTTDFTSITTDNITTNNDTNNVMNITIERNSNVQMIDNNTIAMWDFRNFTYGFINNSRLYLSLSYEGPMPDLKLLDNPYTYDLIEERGAYNYSLKTFCADCSYWNKEEEKWKKDGCSVSSNIFPPLSFIYQDNSSTFWEFYLHLVERPKVCLKLERFSSVPHK